jgi:FkbM family methyltransferase
MESLATLARRWFSSSDAGPHRPQSREQLFLDQLTIAGSEARVILDIGAQHGQNALLYHRDFPRARIFAFEPSPENLSRTRTEIVGKQDRIEAIGAAVGEQAGELELHLNSHDGTHSRLPIGDTRYWEQPVQALGTIKVPVTTIDAFMKERGLADIDILAMDIQGGELPALRGAHAALQAGRIGLIAMEVLFKPLYRDAPLFWEIGAFLDGLGYGFSGLYDQVHAPGKSKSLSWADALFIGPRHL